MKFFCEYCGNRIDAEVDDKCPNCGASYKKNKKFLKLEEEKNKEKELHKEYKDKLFNHTLKFSKWILIIPIVLVLVGVTVFALFFNTIIKKANSIKEDSNSFFDLIENQISGEKEENNVTVDFNGYGETSEYKVKVTKYEIIEDKFNRLDSEYEYVKFHLQVENKTDKEIDSEDVFCIVDGVSQNNYYYSGHSDLPFDISKGLTVKGTATFEVPKDATSYDIRYGDYVTIHIEK